MEGKERKQPIIPQSEGTLLDFIAYCDDERFEKIKDGVRKKLYTANKTDVAYRVLNHWDQNGLLPIGMKEVEGAWRRFTFIERVWMQVIKRLRAFGLSLETIARIQKQVMQWDDKDKNYPYFEYFTIKAWFNTANPYILVRANGDADVGTMQDIEFSKKLGGYQDILLISLKSILQGFNLKVTEAHTLFGLSPAEIALLCKIHVEGSDEIKVKTDGDGKITELETTDTITDPPPNYELQKQLKDEGVYGEVVTKYEGGKSRSVRITKKKRFDAKK